MQLVENRPEAEMLAGVRERLLRLPPDLHIPGIRVFRANSNSYKNTCVDRPLAGLTVSGRKHLRAGTMEFDLTPGIVFVSCVDMPCSSVVLQASVEAPYLSLSVGLERKILADIMTEMPTPPAERIMPAVVAWTMPADSRLLSAFFRCADLLEHPEDVPVLAPLIIRELHFLILASPQGHMLRHLYMHDARDGRIVDVIAWMKQNVASQTNMEDLARMAHMSVSSFHRHFKGITGLSPLQYHKKLKLQEAQRLMIAENERVSEAAMSVGYESISQFNREYRRMFGEAPRKDVRNRLQKLAQPGKE